MGLGLKCKICSIFLSSHVDPLFSAIKFAMIAVRGVNDVLAEALLQYDDEHATPEADAALVAQILAPSTMSESGEGGELRASKSTGSERKGITKRKVFLEIFRVGISHILPDD